MMRRVIATAPTRVDLAGGTLDLPPLYLFHPGALTVNAAIDQLATCEVTTRADTGIVLVSRDVGQREVYPSREALRLDTPLQLLARLVAFFAPPGGIEVTTACAAPHGSGLGGSSALVIALAGALNHLTGAGYTPEQLLRLAPNIETQVIRVPAGVQDYYPAVHGGISAIHLGVGGICHESLAADWLPWLDAHVVVCHTGQAHFSGTNNWEIFRRHIEGDPATQSALARIRDLARAMYAAVCARDLGAVAEALEQEWHHRRQLAAEVSTPTIERLMAVARESGALAGKVCGAGGGGCVVFVVAEGSKPDVQAALAAAGGQVLDAHLTTQGLTVTEV
ncbi:GHMP kinase [Chloracidobacterium sp. MS 40/45]|uniref:GHMP family kinase ATP-binding protein n=1 Tax=Chloracidobacterium aggregatum TaxID=2851959 RepID=UPI001B8D1225|nr:GHMP kinase [Chloracidobacterium aggregatum]QUW00907.1 GHMP kinase [Chloracidobacterium sp. MS 40/45]